MNHLHDNIPLPKASKDFGITVSNRGMNHELIPKYQVQRFGHTGMPCPVSDCVCLLTRVI